MYFSRLVLAAALSLSGAGLSAHEFWIEPQKFQVESGDVMEIDLKNGQNFVGTRLSYFESQFTRFDLAQGNTINPAEGRTGDSPALTAIADQDGLLVILHETTPNTLKYKEWAKFAKFAAHKDFPDAEADHNAAGWPREDFRESYTRHVKSLVAVGSGAGADRNYGMKTEFVALTNPYSKDFDGQMRVQVLLDNAPRPNAQVEVFQRVSANGDVIITVERTDAQGIATIPVSPGDDYMFDAVVLKPFSGDGPEDVVWQTLWAALTFQVPK